MFKGNVSLNKLAKIFREEKEELGEEVKHNITPIFNYEEAKSKLKEGQRLQEVWEKIIKVVTK